MANSDNASAMKFYLKCMVLSHGWQSARVAHYTHTCLARHKQLVSGKNLHGHVTWIRVHYWLHPWTRFIIHDGHGWCFYNGNPLNLFSSHTELGGLVRPIVLGWCTGRLVGAQTFMGRSTSKCLKLFYFPMHRCDTRWRTNFYKLVHGERTHEPS